MKNIWIATICVIVVELVLIVAFELAMLYHESTYQAPQPYIYFTVDNT